MKHSILERLQVLKLKAEILQILKANEPSSEGDIYDTPLQRASRNLIAKVMKTPDEEERDQTGGDGGIVNAEQYEKLAAIHRARQDELARNPERLKLIEKYRIMVWPSKRGWEAYTGDEQPGTIPRFYETAVEAIDAAIEMVKAGEQKA